MTSHSACTSACRGSQLLETAIVHVGFNLGGNSHMLVSIEVVAAIVREAKRLMAHSRASACALESDPARPEGEGGQNRLCLKGLPQGRLDLIRGTAVIRICSAPHGRPAVQYLMTAVLLPMVAGIHLLLGSTILIVVESGLVPLHP